MRLVVPVCRSRSTFDLVCSAIGTQFAPDHRAVARELARACAPAGRLGLACWTPDSVVAQMFGVMRPFLAPPPTGAGNTFDWGREEYVASLLGADFELDIEARTLPLVWQSGEEVWETFVAASVPPKRWRNRSTTHGARSSAARGSSCSSAIGAATRSGSRGGTC